MARRTKKAAAVELRQVDNRTVVVGPLFPTMPGWWVQADCGPWTGEHVTYTADGPFEDVREAIANAHEQAGELGWERSSYHVSVDE